MKRIVLVLVLLIAAVAAALVILSLGKPAPKATDLLPDTTLLFADVPNFAKSRAEFRQTAAYALWHEPEVQAFLRKPLRALSDAYSEIGDPDEDTGNVGRIIDALQGEAFFAVTHVTAFPSLQAGVVFGADVKRKRLETMAALRSVERSLREQHRTGMFDAKTFLGVKYSIWEIRPGYPICHAFLNSMLVFTLGEDTMRDVITRFTGKSQEAEKLLSASAKYRDVVNHMPPGHESVIYLNLEQVMGLLGPFLAFLPQSQGMFQKLARIQATGYSVTFAEGSIQEVAFTGFNNNPGPPLPPATQRKTIALTSPQTLIYSVQSTDLTVDYDEIMRSLVQAQALNPNLGSVAVDFEQQVRRRGVRIREDLLANCGPETALIAGWPQGAKIPDIALVAEIRNPAQTRPALDTAMGVLKELTLGDDEQFPWDETQHAGALLRSVRIGTARIAPTYTTTDKFLIVGLTPDYVREILNQTTGSKPTLATQQEYQRSMKRLPEKGSSYLYCDLRGLFGPLYGLAQHALAGVTTNEYIDFGKLPKSETIAKHLTPLVSATVTEEKGETATSFSPVGVPTVFVTGAAVVAGILSPQLPALPNLLGTNSDKPTTSSDTDAHLPEHENQTATSQTPGLR